MTQNKTMSNKNTGSIDCQETSSATLINKIAKNKLKLFFYVLVKLINKQYYAKVYKESSMRKILLVTCKNSSVGS